MRRFGLSGLAFSLALVASAHVTPNVMLVRRSEFVRASLPGATKFFERTLGPTAVAAVHGETGWTPSAEEAKVYVARDSAGRLLGSVVFLWIPSQHGPLGVGVAFGADGKIRRATVTDASSETLVWIRPLLERGALPAMEGLTLSSPPDPSRIAPAAAATMCRYYAKVVSDGIARAQAIERASGNSGQS